jgi:thiol-disulfide isomerase/thioredoxin
MKKTFYTFILLLCLPFIGNTQLASLGVGDTAPGFTVTDIHGQTHTLSDYAGKWVMVDLFTYWCGPCQAVAPTLNEFYKKYGCNAYDMIILSIEGDGTEQQTIDFENAYGGDASFPTTSISGLDGGGDAVHAAYSPVAYPTIILIGPDGLIKNQDIWPISGVSTFENAVSAAGGSSALIPNQCTAGIDEIELGAISVFPNPSNGDFSINMSNTVTESIQVELISLVGTLVYRNVHETTTEGNSIAVSTESLESGSYLVRLTGLDSGKTKTTSISIR